VAAECLGAAAGDGRPAAGWRAAAAGALVHRPGRGARPADFDTRIDRAGPAAARRGLEPHVAAPTAPHGPADGAARGPAFHPAGRRRRAAAGGPVHARCAGGGRPELADRSRRGPGTGGGMEPGAAQHRHRVAGQHPAATPWRALDCPRPRRGGCHRPGRPGLAARGRRRPAAAPCAAVPACAASLAAGQRPVGRRPARPVGALCAGDAARLCPGRRAGPAAAGPHRAEPPPAARPRWLAQRPGRARPRLGRVAIAGGPAPCLGTLDGDHDPRRRPRARQRADGLGARGSPARPRAGAPSAARVAGRPETQAARFVAAAGRGRRRLALARTAGPRAAA